MSVLNNLLGVDCNSFSDISTEYDLKQTLKVNFVAIPLFHPRMRRVPPMLESHFEPRLSPPTFSDRQLGCNDWVTSFIGKISPWIDVDNVNLLLRQQSEKALEQELLWANHLGLKSILFPISFSMFTSNSNLLRLLLKHSQLHSIGNQYQQYVFTIPFVLPFNSTSSTSLLTKGSEYPWDGWHLWHSLHRQSDYHTQFNVALSLSYELVDHFLLPNKEDVNSLDSYNLELLENFLQRWISEPIKYLIIPTNVFTCYQKEIPSDSSKPSSSPSKQCKVWIKNPLIVKIIQFFIPFNIHLMLVGKPGFIEPMIIDHEFHSSNHFVHNSNDYRYYFDYLKFFILKENEKLPIPIKYSKSYWDVLQSPLQPLMDNLHSSTYEVFEQDPVKYQQYEKGIEKALIYLQNQRQSAWKLLQDILDNEIKHDENEKMDEDSHQEHETDIDQEELQLIKLAQQALPPLDAPILVYVVGAGRGPLIACTLSASSTTNVPVQIIAIEKNPNAIITLRNRQLQEHWQNVEITAQDMRLFQPKQWGELVVSELLGSFGDNELSPECLDGIQKVLWHFTFGYKEKGFLYQGVSVPSKYTSYLAPVSSSLAWMSARENIFHNPSANINMTSSMASSIACNNLFNKGLETPYVVQMRRAFTLSSPKACWSFHHPHTRCWPMASSAKKQLSRHLDPRVLAICRSNEHNQRHTQLTFSIDALIPSTCHGFIGYFDSDLFEQEMLSILPTTHSKDMFSWFPIYFPLIQPLIVNPKDEITIDLWRCSDDHRVWYEWGLSQPIVTPLQNVFGRSYSVGL